MSIIDASIQVKKFAEDNEWLKQQIEQQKEEFNQKFNELINAVGIRLLPDRTLKMPKVVIENPK